MKDIKTCNFWRFQAKLTAPLNSEYFFTCFSTGQNKNRHLFLKMSFSTLESLHLDDLKTCDYAQTIIYSEKLQIAYIKAEKDTRKHIFWYLEGQRVVPQGPLGRQNCILSQKSVPQGALADKIIFWARVSSRRGLLGKIFDKLRIRGRMQIIEKKKKQKALNHVLIG